ncbi:response regulator transcription factor [Streptomyces sp. N35]|uniref:response regulator n=1 Tax=Streptomyces sp. N35 TaxID=2795730 RepID=UPI0018F74070|nr:response regulator transcription factor [Streptomyces sp. N35]
MPVDVVLVDDEPQVREGVKALLEATDDIVVVGQAADGAEAVSVCARVRPDVVLMDVNMPKVSGITAVRRLQDLSPRPRILMLTAIGDEESCVAAFQAGADGFILKSARTGDLIRSVLAVAEGDPVVAPEIMRMLIRRTVDKADPEIWQARQRVSTLNGRERDVLALLGSGASNARISSELFMAEGTVKAYVSRLLTELKVENRTQAALIAHQLGLVVQGKSGQPTA